MKTKAITTRVLTQDCLLSLVASLSAILLVRWLSEPIPGFTFLVLRWLGCAAVATLAGSFLSGSYKVVRRWATFHSIVRLIQAVLIKEALLLVVLLTGLVRLSDPSKMVVILLSDAFLTIMLLSYIRYAARVFSKSEVARVRHEAARGNALVAGTDAESVALGNRILSERSYNLVGYLTRDKSMAGFVIGDVPVYFCDGADDLAQLEWKLGGVDCVFFPQGSGTMAPDQSRKDASLTDASRDGGEGQGNDADMPVQDGMTRLGQAVKRGCDILLSAILTVIFFPVGLLCALAVKMEDGGPVFFRQERIGRNGQPFTILKFRSMRTDAEAGGAQLWSGDEDPRLTRVGSFLRRHHLDELPQLLNVLRGDMSFIGYRPERACYIEQIMAHNPRYRYLYQIRPGVTSYATLYNGYTDSLEKMLLRLDLDLYYLRNHSLRFDARVLGLTFLSIVSGKEF